MRCASGASRIGNSFFPKVLSKLGSDDIYSKSRLSVKISYEPIANAFFNKKLIVEI